MMEVDTAKCAVSSCVRTLNLVPCNVPTCSRGCRKQASYKNNKVYNNSLEIPRFLLHGMVEAELMPAWKGGTAFAFVKSGPAHTEKSTVCYMTESCCTDLCPD